MKNDRVRCVARWRVRGAVAVVGSGSDSPLNPTLVTRRMEFCMQTAAVFNLLRRQSGSKSQNQNELTVLVHSPQPPILPLQYDRC